MSKALKFLSEARPESMSAYFSFLKSNGKSLDDTTRALISIITKVANQTEAGLLQYSRKALQNGVSEDQVLDALMMAFPVLGLSKIIWAVDILLDAGLLNQETDHEADKIEPANSWYRISRLDDLPDNETVPVAVGERYLYVTRNATACRVFEARCTHHDSNLFPTKIANGEVECPLHGWRFEIASGRCLSGGRDLREFQIKIEDDVLYALW